MYHVKRQREEEDDIDGLREASKRIRTLPFRTSPTSQHSTLFSSSRHVPKPPSLAPAESSDDDSETDFHSPDSLPIATIPTFFNTDTDMDYDMADSQPMESPMFSPKTTSCGMLGSSTLASPVYTQLLTVASPSNMNGRVPTPIYGHFAPLQRTSIANANSPTAANPPPAGVVRTTNEQHDAFLRRRRLPSPIREDFSSTSPTTATQDMLEDLDMNEHPASAALPDSSALMSPLSPSSFGRRKSSGASDGSTYSAGRRRRSDAVSAGGENRKYVFSMGFRADCEKCRERVPGHYSHVLRV